MNRAESEHPKRAGLLATPPHHCSYLAGEEAITAFVDPAYPMTPGYYSELSRIGFRRSGHHVYTPMCERCRACVPVRIPVSEFEARRRHRRIWKRGADLRVRVRTAEFDEAHYQLCRRYLATRHRGQGMDGMSRDEYQEFLWSAWSQTLLVEFFDQQQLVAVAVTDVLDDALSSVYTFFAPERVGDSLGGYAVLWQIQHALDRGLTYLYLGYWIEATNKMRYKAEYLPQERLQRGHWQRVERKPTP